MAKQKHTVSPLLKKDSCYYKVKRQYKVFPSAYASGAIAKCRKKNRQMKLPKNGVAKEIRHYVGSLFIFLLIISLIIFSYKKWLGVILLVITGIIFNTRFINPLGVQYQQWKAVKQQLFT